MPDAAQIPSSLRSFGHMGTAPMLMACSAFGAGLLWARFNFSPPAWIFSGIVLCALGACILLRRRAWRGAMLSVAALFALLGGLAWEALSSRPNTMRLCDFATRDEVELTGVVQNDGVVVPGMYGGMKQTIDLQVDSVKVDDVSEAVNGGARLSLYMKANSRYDEDAPEQDLPSVSPILRSGQRIRLRAKLGVPDNYRNPGAFDYRHYLERQGILVTGGGKLESVEVLNEDVTPLWEQWRARSRRAILGRIHAIWPAEQAAVLDAMLIGDSSSIGRDVRNDFQRSGTYHILVVSGFNVGILAFVVFWILRRLPMEDVAATVITLVLAASYSYLTNAGAPVVRATVMLAIYLITRLLYRERAALNAVSTAALGLLVYDPESLFDPSFQLTFLSVLAIAGIVLPVVELTSGPYHRALAQLPVVGFDNSLAPKQVQFRLDLRMIAGRLGKLIGRRFANRFVAAPAGLALGFYETLVVSGIMQFALALPMAWYFHRATLTALAANALVVPVTALMLPTAIGAICLHLVSVKLALPLKLVTDWMVAFISGTVRLFGSMRVSDLRIATPGMPEAIAAALGIALAIWLLRKKHAWFCLAGLLTLSVTSLWVLADKSFSRPVPGDLEIISIDVGQGDSFLVVTPEGRTLLIDSGGTLNGEHSNFDVGEDVVSPLLWNLGVSRLDAVAVSHVHADHAGGMSAVMHNFRPRELWLAPGAPVHERKRLLDSAAREEVAVIERTTGQQFDFGSARIEVLAPPAEIDLSTKAMDDNSLAFRIGYRGCSVLFIGDMGKGGEERLYSQAPHADILKIAHHGSANATSDAFLAAVHPSFAMISVGRHNSFKHPRPQTLAKLAAARVRTYRTDLFGATQFDLDEKGVRVTSLALNPR